MNKNLPEFVSTDYLVNLVYHSVNLVYIYNALNLPNLTVNIQSLYAVMSDFLLKNPWHTACT